MMDLVEPVSIRETALFQTPRRAKEITVTMLETDVVTRGVFLALMHLAHSPETALHRLIIHGLRLMAFIIQVVMDEEKSFIQKVVPAFLFAIRHGEKLGDHAIEICHDLVALKSDLLTNTGRERGGRPSKAYQDAVTILNKHTQELAQIAFKNKEKVDELYSKHKEEILLIAHINSNIKNPDTSINNTKYPSLKDMTVGFSKSMTNWAINGFKVVEEKLFNQRLDQCKLCEFWDSKALNGGGRCKKCGCSTWAKLKLATEKCPIGKW